jgi:lipid II:glycine glycyltransferase (peptidoglycan interpeptide bridge formation enzyme)
MSTTRETPRDLRKKLVRATSSHKSLKDKHREKQYELKKINSCLSAMQASRDKWRLHSKESEKFVKDLKKELCDVTKEREDLLAQISVIELIDKKKREN